MPLINRAIGRLGLVAPSRSGGGSSDEEDGDGVCSCCWTGADYDWACDGAWSCIARAGIGPGAYVDVI